jgi:hypothetical protein
MNILNVNLLEKRLRAEVIKEHLEAIGERRVVCFTCGNAARALEEAGLDVVAVGDHELLKPQRWFTFSEIARTFRCFDATSGHLPLPIMAEIAARMSKEIGPLVGDYQVPTGSGETLVVLSMAYPDVRFHSIRYEENPPTQYNEGAPLNALVVAIEHISNHKMRGEEVVG